MIIDQRQTTVCEEDTIYQAICTEIMVEDSRCFTYGLQVLDRYSRALSHR